MSEFNLYGYKFSDDNLIIKEYEDLVVIKQIIYNLDNEVSFLIDVSFDSIEIINNELVINKELAIESPIMEDNNGNQYINCKYNVSKTNNGIKFSFVSDYEGEKENESWPIIIKTIIKRFDKSNSNEEERIFEYQNNSAENIEKIDIEIKEDEKINLKKENISQDIFYNFETKENIVRKRVVRFVEKLLVFKQYEFKHIDYKTIVYRERACNDLQEQEIKNLYDSFIYLISDYKNVLTSSKLKKFIYAAFDIIVDDLVTKEIVNCIHENRQLTIEEQSSILYFDLQNKLTNIINEKYMFLLKFMLINFLFVNNGFPIFVLHQKELEKFSNSKDQNEIKMLFLETKNKNIYQTGEYYSNLRKITPEEIKEVIEFDYNNLRMTYKFNAIYLIGSFSKGEQRIDSDIDLLISFDLDASSEEVNLAKDYLGNLLRTKLARNVDLIEKINFLNDDLLIEFKDAWRII